MFSARRRGRPLAAGAALILSTLVIPATLRAAEAPARIETWARNLTDSSDREARREAVYQLGKLGPEAKPALPALLKALDDNDTQIWEGALAAIANMGPAATDAIEPLIRGFDSRKIRGGRTGQRLQTLFRESYALAQIGPAAVPALTQALESDNTVVRMGAAKALGGIGPRAKEAVPALIKNLGHNDEQVRLEAVDALSLIGEAAVKPLTEVLSWNDPHQRQAAVQALGELGSAAKPAGPALAALAEKETDAKVRQALFGALPKTGVEPARCAALLLTGLRSDDEATHHAALNAALENKALAPLLLPALVADLHGAEPLRRKSAAQALGRMGEAAKAAAPALIERAKAEPNDPVYGAALAQMGAPALRPLLESLSSGKAKPEEQQWIFHALSAMGTPALQALGEELRSPVPELRAAAASALASMPLDKQPVVAELLKLTGDQDPRVRAAALRTLSKVRSEREVIVPKLEAALQDPDPGVQRAATAGLAATGSVAKLGIKGMIMLLDDPEPATQSAAILALADQGAHAAPAVAALTQKLNDPALQGPAMEALGRIGPAASSAVPAMAKIAKNGSFDQRTSAFLAMGNIGSAGDAMPLLYQLSSDPSQELRSIAIPPLIKLEKDREKLLPFLFKWLNDESGRVRRPTAQALIAYGEKAEPAVPTLFAMLSRDKDRPVALETLKALPIRTIPPLLAALDNKDPGVRVFACDALGKLGPEAKEAAPALEQRVKSDGDKVRQAAKKALERIGPPSESASAAKSQ